MSAYSPHLPNRRSIRLKDYDYSQAGLYFITICCQDRACLFGEIMGAKNISQSVGAKNISPVRQSAKMVLNDAGKMAVKCWEEIPEHFKQVILHEYVIMPNHIHGIIELSVPVRAKNISPAIQTDNCTQTVRAKNISQSIQTINDLPTVGAKNISPLPIPPSTPASSPSPTPMQSPSQTIGSVIRGFKIGVTKWMRQNTDIYYVWQRNYYDHIIRNEESYRRISEYILNNPAQWADDKFYTE